MDAEVLELGGAFCRIRHLTHVKEQIGIITLTRRAGKDFGGSWTIRWDDVEARGLGRT